MTYKPGDILLVEVRFTDQTEVKQRPALVLSTADPDGDFMVAPITSQSGRPNVVPLTTDHLSSGSLPKASWVKTDQTYTISTTTIVRKYATVKDSVMKAVHEELCPRIGCRR